MNFKLLKNKDFLLLMFGKITSLVGSSMQNFALSLYVLKVTGSAVKFAGILAITTIPELILGPIAGVFVDRFYRKKIIVILDIVSGIVVSIFASLYFAQGTLPISYIYILVMILSVISTLFQPAIKTIIPTIMKKEDLIDANATDSLIISMGNFLSPTISGILFGIFGLKVIFVLNALTFFISAFSECFIGIPKLSRNDEKLSAKIFIDDFINGIKFAVSKKTIVSIVTLGMILNFALGSQVVGITYISKEILNVTDFQYGLVESISFVGMIVSSLFTKYLGKKYSIGLNVYKNLFGTAVITALFTLIVFKPLLNLYGSNTIPYILMILLSFFMSFCVGIANIFIGVYVQAVVPLDYLGRVTTVLSTVCMAASPLSNMVFGILFDSIEISIIFILSAILQIIPLLIYKKNILTVELEDDIKVA